MEKQDRESCLGCLIALIILVLVWWSGPIINAAIYGVAQWVRNTK